MIVLIIVVYMPRIPNAYNLNQTPGGTPVGPAAQSARLSMERAPNTAPSIPLGSEVSPEEKDEIARQGAAPSEPAKSSDERKLGRSQLINKLNHINFLDQTVTIVFKHRKYPRSLTIKAHPLPCHDENLVCRWVEAIVVEQLIDAYQFESLCVEKGPQLLEVIPELKGIGAKQISFVLPETCTEISTRKTHRYHAVDITAYLFQNGAFYFGRLIDYCAFQFRIGVETLPPQTFQWIDADEPVSVVFTKDRQTLFSGECRIVKQDHGQHIRHINLSPTRQNLRRFSPREYRNTRQQLSPSPDAVFTHPLFGKRFSLKVIDLSGAGLAVEEDEHLAVLLPGLILPELELVFSDGTIMRCMAQVIYSKPNGENTAAPTLRVGLAILDMVVEDHIRLLALLYQASDARAYISNRVDLTALWDFFFETGFIYPQKYEFIQANKARIKATYEKLYHMNPSIASHFIYQDNGRIMAHMGIIRFYEKSWLIQHHAAVRKANNRGGLAVLGQVGRFINDSHRLFSMHMEYVFCYFRPDNKFPNHVFGGAARNIKNPQICSLDHFAYLHHNFKNDSPNELSDGWTLAPVTDSDLEDLRIFYEDQCGGLMLHALHLSAGRTDCSALIETYRKMGLTRDRLLFALHYRGRTCAVIMVNLADLGLNMSDLTNSIKIFALNTNYLTAEILQTVINGFAQLFGNKEIPVLLYPRAAASQMGINFEKTYCLWVHNMQNLDPYFRFLKRLLKFI
jgi:hypothetical protein